MKIFKKRIAIVLTLGILLGAIAGGMFSCKSAAASDPKDYGVFIGVDYNSLSAKKKDSYIKKIGTYKEVVIDASYWTKADIKKLKKLKTKKVYSYINIGSIENFRSYYKKFESYTLGDYENWPEERWMDVSYKKWQTYVINTLAPKLSKKGIDGFFVDNCDVYYHYRKTGIYNGLSSILKGLRKLESVVIINGGDTYVSKVISKKDKKYFTAVNQECVYTVIKDFEKDKFQKQTKDETDYFVSYLDKCKKNKINVYILEYTKSKSLKNKAYKNAKNKGWKAYVSKKVQLT
ncbi:MAG: endo alpha-1,4 polygalactosaminidase [Lachnospiraceae bacterium]|nr:endo alpha-1,4 polygalactosaminidase [Lachnospiraceae bacterium]